MELVDIITAYLNKTNLRIHKIGIFIYMNEKRDNFC
jgi:hypothetical protein